MTIFFKSTRLDGTDFYTGSVDYAAALTSGEPLPELSGDVAFPGPGWYHLATVPTECVGMSWPCRLYEVEPVGDVFMDNAHPHKIGARSVRVLREIEAHRVFGPQGEQVVALIERCWTLSAAEADRLYADRDAARNAAWNADWDAAWNAALDAARDAARYAARDAAWDAAWNAACAAAGNAARDAARSAAWDAAWYADRVAARDAAVGLLCRDLTGQAPGWDQDAYDMLTGPWRDVIGPIHPDDGRQRMIERRPHWDDELVDAVIHEIGVLRPSPPPLANTAYAVIAAVEDWARWEHVPKGTLAAVQRVRELLDSYVPCESGDPDDCVVCAVRRALEGNA